MRFLSIPDRIPRHAKNAMAHRMPKSTNLRYDENAMGAPKNGSNRNPAHRQSQPQDGSAKDRRVTEVLHLISSSYHQPLTCEILARRVNLSPSQLHSLFRLHANTTPHAAITAKRMEKAAELLCTTHLLVKEVAAKVGIHNDSHFVRDFKATFGLSPTAYREQG
jgi:transcriptional regulator GlxA family with amidase domain